MDSLRRHGSGDFGRNRAQLQKEQERLAQLAAQGEEILEYEMFRYIDPFQIQGKQ